MASWRGSSSPEVPGNPGNPDDRVDPGDVIRLSARRRLRGQVIMVGGENNAKSCRGLARYEAPETDQDNDGVAVAVVDVRPAKSRTWVSKR